MHEQLPFHAGPLARSTLSHFHARWSSQFFHTLGTFGHPVHAWLAALWCLGCCGPAAGVELLCLPLYGVLLGRLPFVRRSIRDAFLQPSMLCILAWAAWSMASLIWTRDRTDGLHEIEYMRWTPAILALWAVLDRRSMLIAAICVGFALAQFAQLAEFFWLRQGFALFSHPQSPNPLARISGWWHQPAVGGAMLVAAVGLHIGPALFGRGWQRGAGLVGSIASIIGILASGTRGALVAAAVLVAIFVVAWLVIAMRASSRHPITILSLSLILLLCIAGAVASPLGTHLRERAAQASEQLSRAFRDRDYDSDMGGRVVAMKAALDATKTHLIQGVGVGGFLCHTREYVEREQLHIQSWRVDKLRTAHNTYLHALATTGIIGLLLLLGTFVCALWGASWELRHWGITALGRYASAPLGALLALGIMGCFETIYLNMSTAALATTLVAMCNWHRFSKAIDP